MLQAAVLAWLRLSRVFQRVDRVSSMHLRKLGLSLAQFDVLAHVGATKGITQQELADSLLVTKGNVSQLLDRLEKMGLLRRCQDGRVKNLVLTEKGQEVYARVVPAQEQLITEHFSALSTQEIADLQRILRKLDASLR